MTGNTRRPHRVAANTKQRMWWLMVAVSFVAGLVLFFMPAPASAQDVPDSSTVTAESPTFTDPCGTDDDTVTIPSKANVRYLVNGDEKKAKTYPASGSVAVAAFADTGYVLLGQNLWSHTYSDEPCEPADDDGDGVPNDSDECPGTSPGTDVGEDGCRLPPEPIRVTTPWTGNGGSNLPCKGGTTLWNLTGFGKDADLVSNVVLTVNGSSYTMSPNGNIFKVEIPGPATDAAHTSASTSWTWSGYPEDKPTPQLVISHCEGATTTTTTTTMAPTTTTMAPTTTVAPTTTKPPVTTAPPTTQPATTAPATTKPPVTTAPATTKPPSTTVPATTKPPTTTAPATTQPGSTTAAPTTAAPTTPTTTAEGVPHTGTEDDSLKSFGILLMLLSGGLAVFRLTRRPTRAH